MSKKICFIFVFQILRVHHAISQRIYEDKRKIHGPFTKYLKENAYEESVKTCGILLKQYGTMDQLTKEKIVELEKAGLRDEDTVSLYKNRSQTCQLQLEKLEMNVSEYLNTIDSLSKLNLNADLELQDLKYKINTESNTMLTVNKSLSFCKKKFDKCSKEKKALEERLQNCEYSLESTTEDFSELEIQKKWNVSCTETQSRLEKKTEELEHNLTEYKSLLQKSNRVPKRILSWSVDELCRNIPTLVFEDKELCPFFYDCSKTSSNPQQCQYPQLFSDINARCEDPRTVNCGERKITYGYTCDFESLSDSNCFLVNSDSGTFNWTRHTGSTPSDGTGPNSAYHGSYYMYIETSSPRQYGDNAVLQSNKTFQDRIYCLSLFYHMRGSNIGRLIIKTENISYQQTVLKQISGEQGSSWQKMDSLNVSLNGKTRILIEATRGSSFEGDISIDLVTLWPRNCP